VAKTTEHAKSLKRAAREPITPSAEAFLARLDGLVVGQRASNGLIKGQTFRHPDLNVFMQVPDGWDLENTHTQLAAAPKDGDMAVVLQAVAEGNDPLDGARALEKASKTNLVSQTHPAKINGLPAARTKIGDSKVTVDITWIAHGGLIYQVAGFAPTRQFGTVQPIFKNVTESFRPLTPEERAAIRENRIRLVKAREGETVRALAARSNTVWKPEQVAVANNLTDYDKLREGQVIKIAVAEPYEGPKK
jgi:predicted Zn-dependent protease